MAKVGSVTAAQNLDRSITVRRVVGTPNELGEIVGGTKQDVLTVRAARQDVSDGEKFAAGGVGGFLTARFIVRSTARTRGIKPTDTLAHDGRVWNLKGIKERDEGRRRFVELTAVVNVDGQNDG